MLSKSAVRKAGSVMRRQAEGKASQEEVERALAIVSAFRASFAGPLEAVSGELATLLEVHQVQGEVSQRLKRMPTILEKITSRESKLDLSRMQDIGGCRVVLSSNEISELRRLEACVRERWAEAVRRTSDYVGRPRASGYRAVHVVVEQDQRLIEIQLRTQRMHQWAQRVEGLSAAFGTNYKQAGESLVRDSPQRCTLLSMPVRFQFMKTGSSSNVSVHRLLRNWQDLVRMLDPCSEERAYERQNWFHPAVPSHLRP